MIASQRMRVPLREVLTPISREERVDATKTYAILGARWYAKGLFIKDTKPGSSIQAKSVYRVEAGDFVYNRLFAWKGSFAVADHDHHGCYVSNEFPCFRSQNAKLNPKYLHYFLSRQASWDDALGLSTGGTPISRNRLKEDQFLDMCISLPDPYEQDRIVAKLDAIEARVTEAQRLCREINDEADLLMVGLAHRADLTDEQKLSAGWTRVLFADIAQEVFDRVAVSPDRQYPNLGIYSFGRGLFHKPPISGLETSATVLNRVRAGQFIYSRLFAFEGACGLVTKEFDGHFVSNEYPIFSCGPDVLPEFLFAYFRARHVWQALSAGSKGLGSRRQRVQPARLLTHELLLPPWPIQEQIRAVFHRRPNLLEHVRAMTCEAGAMIPAVLDRAFKGEL